MMNWGDKAKRLAAEFGRRAYRCALVSLFFMAAPAHALIVDLDAYVDLPILGPDFSTPLMDGSWVFIYGSGDAVQDPMVTVGTNVIAGSTTGDDVILGAIQIPLNVGTNSGMFFTTVQYESDTINYTYIRFFDTPGHLTGALYWGTSDMFQLGVTLGVSTVQYDQGTQLVATNFNNFVVIPEPSTANLFVVVAGMLWAMRVHRRIADKRRGGDDADDDPDHNGPDDSGGSGSRGVDLMQSGKPAYAVNSQTIYRQRAGPPVPRL